MNAPMSKAATAAYYASQFKAAKQAQVDAQQPQVSAHGYSLIASGVRHDDLLLDFYGEYIKGEGHLVAGVTLHRHQIDLYSLFTFSQIKDFQATCDRHNARDDAADAEFDRDEAMRVD